MELNSEYIEPIYNLLEIYEKTSRLVELEKLIIFSMKKFTRDQI